MRRDTLRQFESIVGKRYVLTNDRATRPFRKGYRYGAGTVVAVVQPGSLLEQWRVLQLAIESDLIVIMQAANTGLTGGSTPFGDDYDREVLIINTLRINRIDLIQDGKQAVCLAGATLYRLQEKLRSIGREPHSVIGSTTIGASVVGGVCNNSGGALLRRGPAFTQMALYARIDETGKVHLVNNLGLRLGANAEEILGRLDRGEYTSRDIEPGSNKLASDPAYESLIRDVDAAGPARFNNDPRLLYEASGSAGKLCVFAVRLDTFPMAGTSRLFYVGTNDFEEFSQLRRHVLRSFVTLPLTAEYLHRSAFDLARDYGKDIYLFLKYFGPERISMAFRFKNWMDGITKRLGLGSNISDRALQAITALLPDHLPERISSFRDRFQHHLLLKADGAGVDEMRAYLSKLMPSASGDFFECDEEEADAALRHRFAAGGACVRYRSVNPTKVGDIVALDVALPRCSIDWRERIPSDIENLIERRSIYGHFFCYVFHYDYIVKKGVDWLSVEHRISDYLGEFGVELPSEHNVGHLYKGRQQLLAFYRSLDPTNSMNPGIGQTSKRKNWA